MKNFSQSICNITILVFVILIIYFSFFKNKDKNNNLKENFFDGQFVSNTACVSNDGVGDWYNAYTIPKYIGGPMISSNGGLNAIYNESANSLLNKCKQLANYKHGESGYSGITVASERNERRMHGHTMGCTIFHGQKQQLGRRGGANDNEIEKSCYINPNYPFFTEEKVCKTEEGDKFPRLELNNGDDRQDTNSVKYIHDETECEYKGCFQEDAINKANMPSSGIVIDNEYNCIYPEIESVCKEGEELYREMTEYNLNLINGGTYEDTSTKQYIHEQTLCQYKGCFDENANNTSSRPPDFSGIMVNDNNYCDYPDIIWNIVENHIEEFYEGEYIEEKPKAFIGNLELDVYTSNSNDIIITADTVPGTYEIEYSTQYNNKESSITKTVIINEAIDSLAPTIELNGEDYITIVQGETWNDPKARASDNMDGEISPERIKVESSLDTETIGTYTLNYWATDNAGNTSKIITRTVKVIAPPDIIPPQIALIGENPMMIFQGDEFVEPGYHGIDETGGLINSMVIIGGDIVDNTNPGDYNIQYSIPESKYGPASDIITRKVIVKKRIDTTPPTINLNGESIVRLNLNQQYVESGVTAETHDGNIIEDVIINGDEVDPNTEGFYTLKYRVIDPESNISSKTLVRIVIVEKAPDINAPELIITGSADMEISVNSEYVDAGATAWDYNGDGDITEKIVPYGSVNPNIANTYFITYTVNDSAGNSATAKRTVTVVALPDETAPILELLGDNPMRIIIGSSYIEEGGQAIDDNGQNLTENIEIDNTNLNTGELGDYEVIYTVSDGFQTTTKIRKVIVYSPGRDLCNETILEKPCEEMSKDECGGSEGVSGIYDGQQAFHCDWNIEEGKCVQGWKCGMRPPNPPPPTEEEWLQKVGHKYQ